MGTGISSIANASTRSSAASLTATAAAKTAAEKDRKTIAGNFDAFLSLLTTQLKNQSPLDPLDSNQFIDSFSISLGEGSITVTSDTITGEGKN